MIQVPRLGLIVYPYVNDEIGLPDLDVDSIATSARAIEAAGFSSVWVYDVIGRQYSLPDPLTTLAVAATVTENVELGTGILQVPLRNPVELAQRVLTTQLVAGGRLLLGVGAGSTQSDSDAVGVSHEDRFKRLRRGLDTMQALWNGETVGTANLHPYNRLRGGPPVLIGSWAGSRWVPRAARDYQGWIASAGLTSWGVLREGGARFREAGGKRAVAIHVHIDLSAEADDDGLDSPATLCCPPDEAVKRLGRFAEYGFTDVVGFATDHSMANLRTIAGLGGEGTDGT